MHLKAKPGAALQPEEILGRDDLVEALATRLNDVSVLVSGERRIGKTSVLTKLVERLGARPRIRENVQAYSTPIQFADALGRWAGIENVDVEWPSTITLALDAIEEEAPNTVIILDEFTWMLKRIDEDRESDDAIELLLHLHRERLDRPSLRFVLSGSISVYSAVRRLRQRFASKDPLSDLFEVVVRPLDRQAAADLAQRICDGEGLTPQEAAIRALIEQVQHRPYYIHDVLSACARRGVLSVEIIEAIVDEKIVSNAWDLEEDVGRIEEAFDVAEAQVALAILDWLAQAPMTRREVIGELEHPRGTIDRLIEILIKDDLILEDAGELRFRAGLRARAWRHHRSLTV